MSQELVNMDHTATYLVYEVIYENFEVGDIVSAPDLFEYLPDEVDRISASMHQLSTKGMLKAKPLEGRVRPYRVMAKIREGYNQRKRPKDHTRNRTVRMKRTTSEELTISETESTTSLGGTQVSDGSNPANILKEAVMLLDGGNPREALSNVREAYFHIRNMVEEEDEST